MLALTSLFLNMTIFSLYSKIGYTVIFCIIKFKWRFHFSFCRELEVLPFKQKVLGLSISSKLPEPFLFILHKDEIGIYRYKRFCTESWFGSFVQQHSVEYRGITKIYSFTSEGREYVAVAGNDGGILRIDSMGTLSQEMKIGISHELLLLFLDSYEVGSYSFTLTIVTFWIRTSR